MAELSLLIKANFDEANDALRKLRKEADKAGMSLRNLAKKFADKRTDEFIAKQKRAAAAVMMTRGEVEALTGEKKAYQREIERLITAGLDPQSDAVQRLSREYQNLEKKIEATKKAQQAKNNILKATETAFKDAAAAVAKTVTDITTLKEESEQFGIVSNENAEQTAVFNNAMCRLKTAAQAIAQELTGKLIPGFIETVEKITNFIQKFDDWEQVLGIAGKSLAWVSTTLRLFMKVAEGYATLKKVAAGIKKIKIAVIALNKAMKATGIGAIVGIIAMALMLLIKSIIKLKRNWEMAQTFLQQGIEKIVFAFRWMASQAREIFTAVVNTIKIAFLGLAETIVRNVFGRIVAALDSLGNIVSKVFPNIGSAIQRASGTLNGLVNGFSQMTEAARQNSRETIESVRGEQQAMRQAHRERLDNISAESRARREYLRQVEETNREILESYQQRKEAEVELSQGTWVILLEQQKEYNAASEQILKIYNAAFEQALSERLSNIGLTERQIKNEQIAAVERFLSQRASMESDDFDEQLAFLKQKKEYFLSEYSEFGDERVAIEKAVNNEIRRIQEKQARNERQLLDKKLSAASQFLDGFSRLLDLAGEENEKAAIFMKSLAIVEAGINTARAATQALASAPPPVNFVLMAATIAKGIAQKAKIMQSIIPSAETGGRFIVPASRGVDSQIMRVNPGERIDVTPRGMSGERESFNFNFAIDGIVFAEIINKQARAGELYTLQLANNF